ncbi:AAA-ATPase At2g46620-like [Zingiber officinale]|uniref:AAA+ ATPase domain-containing protein n=1 Tax=Zingiber officinale TaxID=94328 RepID=A0A8J5GQE2_ZINOF|nr:AAA-ATPase At2g46620-like [Zingiber officinale]KAG6504077.1 hypothetical protein ZIOFF_036405 [Zingiber officinale]
MIPRDALLVAAFFFAGFLLLLRALLSFKSLLYWFFRCRRWVDERTHDYQNFRIPRFDDRGLENPLHRHAAAYVASLPSVERAPAAAVFSDANKGNEFSFVPVTGYAVGDSFRGFRLSWTVDDAGGLLLRLRRQDRASVFRPYLGHVESVAEEIHFRRREAMIFTNFGPNWKSASLFNHPATLDAVAMDAEQKARVRADLEAFLKGRDYYHRLCRVWRRSYLLHGPSGTGKSTFAAAMANFLGYDIYDLDLAAVSSAGELKALLAATRPRSMILVEHVERHIHVNSGGEGMLRFTDRIGEERVVVYTLTGEGVAAALEPELTVDVRVHFPLCDFPAFKALASGYLGLEDHKMYPKVEEMFKGGATMSPAEVSEVMMENRGSPNRALKSLIGALQQQRPLPPLKSIDSDSNVNRGNSAGAIKLEKDTPTAMKELKKLYSLVKTKSKKNGVMPVEVAAAAAAAGTPLDELGKEYCY